ncbi:MAG: 30S ribosome-binding factor RbfA [Oscillospiraceae bacterium]|nr:30S ribosome-binding factor RbfA [Oscillospiraceae bacterium]
MSQSRIGRINEEIMRELSTAIRGLKDPRVQQMLSITAVDTASDLRTAKVYVSVFDKEKSREVLKGLKSAGGYLRRHIGSALQLRYTPELIFIEDHSIEHGTRIFDILSTLDIPEEDHDEQGND